MSTDPFSEIELWRKHRLFAWKPWVAEFASAGFAYTVEAWTARGARRMAESFRRALAEREERLNDH